MQEFKFFGVKVPAISIGCGSLLIVWGILVSVVSESQSITSWAPSLIGASMLLGGILANWNKKRRKLWIHIAVEMGVLSFLIGLDFFRGFTTEGGPFANPYAGASKLVLLIIGGLYTSICIKAFIEARKIRE